MARIDREITGAKGRFQDLDKKSFKIKKGLKLLVSRFDVGREY